MPSCPLRETRQQKPCLADRFELIAGLADWGFDESAVNGLPDESFRRVAALTTA